MPTITNPSAPPLWQCMPWFVGPWFVGLWAAGVVAVGAVATALRWVLHP